MLKAIWATKRSKFVDLRDHYIKDTIRERHISLKHTPSKILRADLFTKPPERQRFETLRTMFYVAEISHIQADITG